MHSTAQQNLSERNTGIRSSTTQKISPRARLWAMTLNNYMESEVNNLQQIEEGYQFVFQEETGEDGKTPHLQGMFYFKQPKTLAAMKKINARAHWEIGKNKLALIQYCSKEETRTGNVYANIPLTESRKHVIIEEPIETEREKHTRYIEELNLMDEKRKEWEKDEFEYYKKLKHTNGNMWEPADDIELPENPTGYLQ